MIKPSFLEPADKTAILGKAFDTPLVVKGWTGFPLIELIAWGIFSWVAGRQQPAWSIKKRIFAGGVTSLIALGSEWCHNLAHAAVASWIGKPVDAIRIFWGTPLLIYYDINDQAVSPRQHTLRALGGPLFNTLMLPIAWFAKRLTYPGSLAHYSADFAVKVHTLISGLALLPIPGLDGGAVLKWSLVAKGRNLLEADEAVKRINCVVGSGLATASGIAIKHCNYWYGAGLTLFAVISLAIGSGLLKEHK